MFRALLPLALFPLALFTGCSDPDAEQAIRLESFSAADGATDDWEARSYDGVAAVTGADRDWQIALDLGDGTTESVAVHAPGQSDLAFLNGGELSVELGNVWGSNPRDFAVDDAEGPAFLAQVHETGVASEAFGDGFARYGDAIGSGTIAHEYGDYGVSYTEVRIATDDGEVSALPGEPIDVSVGGQRWRIVVHAAFEVTEYPDAVPACGGGVSDTLSFEMVRLATEPPLDPISPADGAHLAGEYSCE